MERDERMDSYQIDGSSTQAAAGQDTRNSNTDMPPGEIKPDPLERDSGVPAESLRGEAESPVLPPTE